MGKRIGPLLMALGAIGLWGSSRMSWVQASAEDDKSGGQVVDILGSHWSVELMAVMLLLLAGTLAGLVLRRLARRVVAIVCAVAAAAVAWRPLQLLTAGPDVQRAQDILQAGQDNDLAVDVTSISDWAVITEASAHTAGPVLALVAAAVALFGAVLLATRPGEDTARSNKYETPAMRQEKLAQDLEESPDSGRVLWDALDADIDPTDLDNQRGRLT
ncbi:TIGR02234 family membrane protein [Corynebacterium sp. 32222D000AT]|uniref:TIGR02234 family membrane protein n=1 Tax=unclassified Corynebacterium TaxID=2624378 RepID=UPI002A9527B0|nr:TIGR02234 family membrane protein [Mycobacteriaceae bacterium]MDY5828453.1 TIGR02234 family membrane protein [Corynebacterium sp.]